jgi:hypothetical protein
MMPETTRDAEEEQPQDSGETDELTTELAKPIEAEHPSRPNSAERKETADAKDSAAQEQEELNARLAKIQVPSCPFPF